MAAGLMNGLAKIGGNANNHRALVRSGSIGLGVALMAYHPDDLHVCETVLMLLLPFSFNLEITRVMSEAGAVPVLVAAMVRVCLCLLVCVESSVPVVRRTGCTWSFAIVFVGGGRG